MTIIDSVSYGDLPPHMQECVEELKQALLTGARAGATFSELLALLVTVGVRMCTHSGQAAQAYEALRAAVEVGIKLEQGDVKPRGPAS